MKTYKFKSEEFLKINKGMILSIILTEPLFFIIAFFIIVRDGINSWGIQVMIVGIVVISLLSQLGKIIALKKQWDGFSVDIDQTKITKHQFKTKDLIFDKDKIIKIAEIPSCGLSINDGEVGKYLFIPKCIEGYDNIKEELTRGTTIEVLPVNTVKSQKRIMDMTFYKSKNGV